MKFKLMICPKLTSSCKSFGISVYSLFEEMNIDDWENGSVHFEYTATISENVGAGRRLLGLQKQIRQIKRKRLLGNHDNARDYNTSNAPASHKGSVQWQYHPKSL